MRNKNKFFNSILGLTLILFIIIFSDLLARNKYLTSVQSVNSINEEGVNIDIGQVHTHVTNSTEIMWNIYTFVLGKHDYSEPSMLWLEGDYEQNHYLCFGTFRIGYNHDFIRFSSFTTDDWAVYQNDPTQVSPFDVHFSMTDSLADSLKVGVKCICKVHAWDDTTRDDFLIYEYFVINNSGNTLSDVYAGFQVDGDISSAGGGSGDSAFYCDDMMNFYLGTDINGDPESISYMYDGDNPNIPGDDTGGRLFPKESLGYLGSRVLDCPASTHGLQPNLQSGHQWWVYPNDPQSGSDWYNLMALEQFKPDTNRFDDFRYFQTMGPWDIDFQDTVRIALAFGIGDGLDGLRENLQTAYEVYWSELIPTDVDRFNDSEIPIKYALKQNYPNPFNPKTVIEYQLPFNSSVELSIYNNLGQKVATLVSKKQPAGNYKAEWDASSFASGVYLYRLETDKGFVQTKKLIFLK